MRLTALAPVTLATLLTLSQGAYAQSQTAQPAPTPPSDAPAAQDPNAEGDIIVTAQKKSENLRDVPIAISAIKGQDLTARGFTTSMDLPDLVPGVRSTTPGGGAYVTTIIRGVGQQDIGRHQEAPVATYVDGAYVGLTTALTQPVFDVDRVEVLKGPQGTLFGRNATGGLVQYITRAPSQEFEAYVTTEYGSYDKFMTEGAVGGSLGGDWSGRIAYHAEKGGAYIRNPIGPDHNGTDVQAVRAQLQYKPSSDFRALLSVYADRFPDQPGPVASTTRAFIGANGKPVGVTPGNFAAYQNFCRTTVGTVPTTYSPLGDCAASLKSPYNVPAANYLKFNGKYLNATATIDWTIGSGIKLTSISNYQYSDQLYNTQLASGFPTAILNVSNPGDRQYSEEIRLSGKVSNVDWVAGLYGLWINIHTGANANLNDIPFYGINLNAALHLRTTSYAGFAEATYHFSPKFSVIVGGRVTSDQMRGVNQSSCTTNPTIPVNICAVIAGASPVPLVQFVGFDKSISTTSWSGRIVAQYKLDENVNVYAGVNRGTKAGGFNTGANELYPVSVAEFKPETLVNYEAGVKSRMLNGVLDFNGSIFYYDYKNLQTFSTQNFALYVFNVDAWVRGAEFDMVIRPMRGLNFSASASYLDSKAKNVPVGAGFADFVLPNAPKFSSNVSARYEFDLGPGKASIFGSYARVGRRSTSAVDYAIENVPAYNKVDFRLGYELDRVSFAFNIRNLTNALIYNSGVPSETITGSVFNSVLAPRTFSGSISLRL